MKTKLMLAALLLTVSASAAMAMNDAERARQMELYNASGNGGAMITTETRVTPQQTTTTQTTAGTTTATVPVYSTQGLSQRSTPEVVGTATVQVPETKTETTTNKQMSPLNDDGSPMAVAPKAESLGETTQTLSSTPAAVQVTTTAATPAKSVQERQLEAHEAWKTANPQAVDPNAPYVPPVAPAAAIATTIGPVTTTEKTTTTNYTVTTRKVGMVGNHPYPAQTNDMAGGVVRETNVNGTVSSEVVTPDPVAGLKDQQATGDYYANPQGAAVYRGTVGSVRVHETGKFN